MPASVPEAVRVAGWQVWPRTSVWRWCSARRRWTPPRTARPSRRSTSKADLTVFPEAFARDFGSPGEDISRVRRAARRAVRQGGRRPGRQQRHRRGRDVRVRPRPRPAVQHPRGPRPRGGGVPQDPPLRLLRLPRVRPAHRRPVGAHRDRAERLRRRPDDLLRPALPRARARPGRRRRRRPGGPRGLGARPHRGGARPQGRPLAHAGPGPRDREHGVRRRGRPGGSALHRALDGQSTRTARCSWTPAPSRACTRRSSRSGSSPRPGRPTPRLPTAGTAPDNLSRCPPPAPPASASPSDRRPVGPRSGRRPPPAEVTPDADEAAAKRPAPRRAAAKPDREPRPRRTSTPGRRMATPAPAGPKVENDHPGERVVEPSRTIAGTDAAGPVAAPDRRPRWSYVVGAAAVVVGVAAVVAAILEIGPGWLDQVSAIAALHHPDRRAGRPHRWPALRLRRPGAGLRRRRGGDRQRLAPRRGRRADRGECRRARGDGDRAGGALPRRRPRGRGRAADRDRRRSGGHRLPSGGLAGALRLPHPGAGVPAGDRAGLPARRRPARPRPPRPGGAAGRQHQPSPWPWRTPSCCGATGPRA